MARKQDSSFSSGLLWLTLAGGATLLAYFLLTPSGSSPAAPSETVSETSGAGGSLQFEFYDRLQQDAVETNAQANEPAPPGAAEISQLIEQLTPEEPSPAQNQLEIAAGALEELAQTIAAGLDTRPPEPVAEPEPLPPAPVVPAQPSETILAVPESSRTPGESVATSAPNRPAEPEPEPAPPRESMPASTSQAAAGSGTQLPAATGAISDGTVLQSGAFRREELARRELERQRSLGLDVEIEQRPGQDGALFLIRSSPYRNGQELEEAELVFRLHNIETVRRALP